LELVDDVITLDRPTTFINSKDRRISYSKSDLPGDSASIGSVRCDSYHMQPRGAHLDL